MIIQHVWWVVSMCMCNVHLEWGEGGRPTEKVSCRCTCAAHRPVQLWFWCEPFAETVPGLHGLWPRGCSGHTDLHISLLPWSTGRRCFRAVIALFLGCKSLDWTTKTTCHCFRLAKFYCTTKAGANGWFAGSSGAPPQWVVTVQMLHCMWPVSLLPLHGKKKAMECSCLAGLGRRNIM